ncbi:integrase catalytic domain-containing protein [Trichonephila clavipes]|nr:integrase catalytic domain-containing protein [Trichonephila clavipes]
MRARNYCAHHNTRDHWTLRCMNRCPDLVVCLNNSILLNGGIIQLDLFSIVSRFRKHEYAFSADIKKMYRRILVDPNQWDLQRIMWKTSADAPVKTYKLATVIYGTVSAPFLATRTLKVLADEEKAEFPDAADVICNDSYMDYILSGESTLKVAKKLQTRLSQLLQRDGFELHKWVSNIPEMLKDLSVSSYVFDKEFQDAPVKTLGMLWDPKVDCLTYKTDSTIALAWIKTEPHKLKTFVSNRVAEIQALSKDYHWKHVSSKNNLADLISRGCNVDELLKNEMWFSGPDLQTDEYEDNQLFPDPSYRDELKCAVTLSMTECSSNFYDELFNVTNNFIKLIRIFSFIFRFVNNIRAKESCNKEKYLTANEIKRSTEFLAKIAQLSEFKVEIDALKKGKGISKSKLKALDLFLDENSLLRVGGRLSNADLPFEAKHQIIIPSKHKFTKLLFEHMHKKFFHIGARGLVHQIRMQFWPIIGKGIARKTVHDCIACFRQKPTGVDQLMGNLPSKRVTPCAAAELNRFMKLICNKNETLASYFASEAIQWKFIPPRSPNFGGLWEAVVKSFKHHLYRTLVNSKITFEKFETIKIQIEGILNSRPLVPLSDNINEYEVLTPGHFIIGRPISAIPEPAILDISDDRLSRWQYNKVCTNYLETLEK